MDNINIGKPVFCPSTTEVRYGVELPMAGSRGPMPCPPGPMPSPIPGPTGPQGPQGPQGLHGHLGPQGPQGAMGTGVTILGVFSEVTELPLEANVGDSYVAGSAVYAYVGYNKGDKDTPNFAWKEYQRLVPVPGVTGPQGIQGKVGPKGETGPTGPQGERGRDGYVVLKFKEDAIHCTEVGDGFIAQDNGHLYILVKAGAEPKFVDAGKIQGPEGPVGPQGDPGVVRDTSDLVKVSSDEDIIVKNKIGCFDVGEVIKSTDSVFSVLKKLFSGEEMETKLFYGAVAQDYYDVAPTAEIIRSLTPMETYDNGTRLTINLHPDSMGVLVALPKNSGLEPSNLKGTYDDLIKLVLDRSTEVIYDGTPYIIYYGVSTSEWGIDEQAYLTINNG